ncbi:MAG: DUF5615 family PIN-like protein [Bacteroidetes bacterium]|nr:DUF5615 family PIN-like protein [Bacteroidota bacterium]MBI3481642.1 DUF5615 family PIN-like protein [Bacteroidota bacterium]
MKFILDAQLPVFLCHWLTEKGYPSIHTSFLPYKNKTPDSKILELAEAEGRVVVSKDTDFYKSFFVRGKPKKLLLVSTGNIKNSELKHLFESNIDRIAGFFEQHSVLELTRNNIIIHQ